MQANNVAGHHLHHVDQMKQCNFWCMGTCQSDTHSIFCRQYRTQIIWFGEVLYYSPPCNTSSMSARTSLLATHTECFHNDGQLTTRSRWNLNQNWYFRQPAGLVCHNYKMRGVALKTKIKPVTLKLIFEVTVCRFKRFLKICYDSFLKVCLLLMIMCQ